MRLNKTSSSKDEDFDIPSETVIPSFSGSSAAKPATSEPRSAPPKAVVGPKIKFKGELSGEEDLRIEGTVEGTIELKNHNLIVGEQGTIRANVLAKGITIEGTVEGDLVAEDHIAIKSSSNVKGNLTADRVTLEDGAKFRGSIDMDTKASSKGAPKFSGVTSTGSSSNSNEPEKA